MYRIMLAALALLIVAAGCSGPLATATPDQMAHAKTYDVPGKSAAEIRAGLVKALASRIQNSKDAIQHSSDDMIVVNTGLPSVAKYASGLMDLWASAQFMMTIDIKDGRVRFDYSRYDARSEYDMKRITWFAETADYHTGLDTRLRELERGMIADIGKPSF